MKSFLNAACIVALLDRLLHHADLTVIEGDSYRVREVSRRLRRGGGRNDPRRLAVAAGLQPGAICLFAADALCRSAGYPFRASASDQWLACRFHDDGVPLHVVETALLLGSLRRLVRPADDPQLAPIRSLAYFRPFIDELCAHPAPESYLDYLRLKLRQAAVALPANVQESTFSDDR